MLLFIPAYVLQDKSLELHELRDKYSRLEMQIEQAKEKKNSLTVRIPIFFFSTLPERIA